MSDLDSKFERLLSLIGGSENLPPQSEANEVNEVGDSVTASTASRVVIDGIKDTLDPTKPIAPLLQPSEHTTSQPSSFAQKNMATFTFDARKGEPAPRDLNFSPFMAVVKFCYKFIPKSLLQPVATAFFDQNKIYDSRQWDLYYVSTIEHGVVIFVPLCQLEKLLKDINSRFTQANIRLRPRDREQGLVTSFTEFPKELRPHWLGRCSSRAQYNYWTNALENEPKLAFPMQNVDRCLQKSFTTTLERSIIMGKTSKGSAASSGKAQKQYVATISRQNLALQAQRYLGLRTVSVLPETEAALSNVDSPASLITTEPPRFDFDSDVIFIAIDVEAWEKANHPVTEVGIATLDTRDLHGIAPGELGKEWRSKIRARHLRVSEYKNYTNNVFVHGCPDRFDFGTSEFVPAEKLASVVTSCFHEPYSATNAEWTAGSATEARNLVVVGHDLGSDVEYCASFGFSVFNRGNILASLDTVPLYRALTSEANARSLGSILYDFEIPGWNLHNAGNDAVYTLQAMLAICVASSCGRIESRAGISKNGPTVNNAPIVESAPIPKDFVAPPAQLEDPNVIWYGANGEPYDA